MTRKSNAAMNALARTVPVLPYQERWVKDNAQLKVAVWSRQSGKSFAAALRAVLKCIDRRTQYIVLSKGERQSRLFMEKVKDFCEVFKAAKVLPEYAEIMPTSEDKVMEVFFPHNHSRIIGLPANPDTARGYSGDVFLDEFALHRDSRAIWGAMMTRATRGYKVRVASTFKGTENKFYELAKLLGLNDGVRPEEQPVRRNGWSGHWVDIYMAKAQGMPVDIQGQKAAIDDEEIWLQDYCNVPMNGAECFIPLELVLACESGEAQLEWDGWTRPGLCAGMDIGRKRDRTVILLGEPMADMFSLVRVPSLEFHGGYAQKATSTKFKNLRSQFYWVVAKKFEKGLYNLKQLPQAVSPP